MQKRIVLTSFVLGIAVLFIAGAYYIAIYLPQKQKASMEVVRLELEARIEQEKTEQAKIEQKRIDDDAKKAELLVLEQQKKEEEVIANNQKNIALRNACLANASNHYKKVLQQLGDDFSNSGSVDGLTPEAIADGRKIRSDAYNDGVKRIVLNYDRAKNDCYHKYPLPNENF